MSAASSTIAPAPTPPSTLNWDVLGPLLQCPACTSAALKFAGSEVTCGGCGKKYPFREGFLDFVGETSPELPVFYADPNYRAFIANLAKMHEAHYRTGGFSNWIETSIKRDLFRLVRPSAAVTVDLGCGLGEGFAHMGADENIIGVDFEVSLLRETHRLHPRATLVRASLANLPFRAGVLRRVFAIGVLEHVFYLEAALVHIQRCLSREGEFYVAIPTEGSLAVESARLVTSSRNAKLIGITPQQSASAQRKDHCNTVFLIENMLRKFFEIDAASHWPFRIGGSQLNLSKSYRLLRIAPR